MHKKLLCLILTALMLVSALTACGSDSGPTLPKIDLDSSSLTGTVEYVNGRTCRVRITEGDSHFDGPHENSRGEMVDGDTIQVTYTTLDGSKSLKIGDSIRFSYHYASDVSEKNGDPHITVNQITVS